jgi:23S rRNA pseudouridine1911/1915/1917 synthase
VGGPAPTEQARSIVLAVPPELSGERLDKSLTRLAKAAALPESWRSASRARWQRLLVAGGVHLDGAVARASTRLRGGERVQLELPPAVPIEARPEPMRLDVLYEDADLIAVNKPAGLAVHPGAGRPDGTLVNGLLHHCRDLSGIGGVLRPGIVHRLDIGTSGVIVVAKHDRAHVQLHAQFAERRAQKLYVAFVLGVPRPAHGSIDTWYGRHPTQRLRFTGRLQRGKRAITVYRVEQSAGGLSEVHVDLRTGRTHQIRVHMAELGHPLAGDGLYGGRQPARVRDGSLRRLVEALRRPALHAWRLTLTHPKSGKALRLEAPWPEDLLDLRAAMLSVTHEP